MMRILRCFFASIAMLSVLFGPLRADDQEQEALIQRVQNQALLAMPQKDFVQLEKMAETYRTEKTRKPSGGWLLDVYYDAVQVIVCCSDADSIFEEYTKLFDEWRVAYPNSPTPIIAKAELLQQYAWTVRGSGYANEVFDNQMKVFHEKSSEALKLLLEAPGFVRNDPRWYSLVVRTMGQLGVPRDAVKAIALEGIAREPGYYSTYFSYLRGLAPQWGGSFEDMDNWINEATALPQADQADGLYARMYWVALGQMGRRNFAAFDVDWERLKKETTKILERHPSVANLESAMSMACRSYDPDEVRLRWAALVKIAPNLKAEIDPPTHCRWERTNRDVIDPSQLRKRNAPMKTSQP